MGWLGRGSYDRGLGGGEGRFVCVVLRGEGWMLVLVGGRARPVVLLRCCRNWLFAYPVSLGLVFVGDNWWT